MNTPKLSIRNRRILVAALVVVAVAAAAFGLLRTPLFDAGELRVEGNDRLRSDEVFAVAGLRKSTPLVSVDESAAEKRLESDSRIEKATVSVDWPGVVEVVIQERVPLLIAETADKRWAEIGAGGVVMTVSPAPPAGLPAALGVVVQPVQGSKLDPAMKPIVDTAAILPVSLRSQVSQIQNDQTGMRLGVKPDVVVIIGSQEMLSAKLTAAATVLENTDPATIGTLDVTSPALPVTTPAT